MKNTSNDLAEKYIMEDPREPKRLSSKVDAEKWVEQYLSIENIDEFKVLDVGCGSGDINNAIAKKYPNIQVVGIDFSNAKLDFAKENFGTTNNLSFVHCDAFNMPFKANTFNLVISRFLFEYLQQPQQLLQEMKRVCQQQGTIMVQDLDGQFLWHYPVNQLLSKKVDKVMAYLKKNTGFDPLVGRKLYTYFHHENLVEIDVKSEPYHFYAGKIDNDNYMLWEMKLNIILPRVAEALGSMEEATMLKKEFLDYLLSEETFTYSNIFTVSGKKSAQKNSADEIVKT